jgi:purine-binding chemotaxis protein CheW
MTDAIEEDDDLEALEDEKELANKFLIFSLGNKEFGLKIQDITEIVGILPITEIPNMPEYLKGIVNLRGKGIPVLDARLRFGNPSADYTDKTVIIILNFYEQYYGLIVDGVKEVTLIPEVAIEPSIDFKTNVNSQFVTGLAKINDKVKIILSTSKILTVKNL